MSVGVKVTDRVRLPASSTVPAGGIVGEASGHVGGRVQLRRARARCRKRCRRAHGQAITGVALRDGRLTTDLAAACVVRGVGRREGHVSGCVPVLRGRAGEPASRTSRSRWSSRSAASRRAPCHRRCRRAMLQAITGVALRHSIGTAFQVARVVRGVGWREGDRQGLSRAGGEHCHQRPA